MTDNGIRLWGWLCHWKTAVFLFCVLTVSLLYATYGLDGRKISELDVMAEYMDRTESVAVKKRQTAEAVGKIRLLCLILTMEKDLRTKVQAVNKTWATRCDKHFYIITSQQKRHDFLNVNITDDRRKLVFKMQKVYQEVYDKYLNDFDFLLKADDDTYVIVENLKFLLWHYDANKPGYLGYHFNKKVKSGFMSGGAGYVISNSGLRHLITRGYRKGVCKIIPHKDDPENSEDVETGRCLEAAGVPVWSSLDFKGRETFHPYTLDRHFFGQLPAYIYSWVKHPVQKGEKCCSRYAVSYHYVFPDAMYFLHHVLYGTTVFRITEDSEISGRVFNVSVS